MANKAPAGGLGIVVIGRNEGPRLRACLGSLGDRADLVVYVDSGSTDDSLAIARASGAEVVELDMTRPFTAARARNVGFARVLEVRPTIEFVQFVDGDCEVVRGWLGLARGYLEKHPDVAVVCGRRRERDPERSVYNRLCDIEWNRPIGMAKACGGDAMMRVSAFKAVGGFNDDMIAGEEPELCLRLGRKGWRIWRLDADMTLHDAAIARFSQWWRRTVRGGYGFALGAVLHGRAPERHYVRETARAVLWGGVLPLLAIGGSIGSLWWLVLFAAYPVQVCRLAWRRGPSQSLSWIYAGFMVMAHFAELQGILKFVSDRIFGRRSGIIEYKSDQSP